MKRQCTTMVLLALLAAVFTGQLLQTTANKNGYFDCRRQGLNCGTNGFCGMQGKCTCKENHFAIFGQCVDEKTLEGNCTNDDFCENGGLCHVVRNESVCFCQDAFQGERCQRKRLEVKCYLHGMGITVRPYPGFQGIISSRYDPVDECRLKENQSDPSGPVFHSIVPFGFGDKYCGMISTLVNGSRLYRMDLVIQYTPQIVFNTDQLLTSTCVFSKTGQVELQVGQPYIDSDNLTKAEDSKDITPLIFEVKDKDGLNLQKTSTVTVGDELNLVVKMQNNAAFTTYRVHAASASNGRDTFTLVENGCPRKHQVLRPFSSIAGNTTTTVTIPIYAFKFISGEVVYFKVVVFMCEESSGACESVMCDNQTDINNNRLRRRRRAAEEEVVLTGQVRVKLAGDTLEENSEELEASEMEACMQQPEVQMMAILLGAGVVALAIACVTVFACMWRRARQGDKLASPSLSSPSRPMFSIPRAKFEAAY